MWGEEGGGSPERHLQLFMFCWPKRMKKSGEAGCQPGPVPAVRAAAAYFIWKSTRQNAVNCQTSDFGSYRYTQNIENPRVFGSVAGVTAKEKTK